MVPGAEVDRENAREARNAWWAELAETRAELAEGRRRLGALALPLADAPQPWADESVAWEWEVVAARGALEDQQCAARQRSVHTECAMRVAARMGMASRQGEELHVRLGAAIAQLMELAALALGQGLFGATDAYVLSRTARSPRTPPSSSQPRG